MGWGMSEIRIASGSVAAVNLTTGSGTPSTYTITKGSQDFQGDDLVGVTHFYGKVLPSITH